MVSTHARAARVLGSAASLVAGVLALTLLAGAPSQAEPAQASAPPSVSDPPPVRASGSLTADTVVGRVAVGGPSSHSVLSPDGTTAYVSVPRGFRISVLDVTRDSPAVQDPQVPANSPKGLAVSPDGATLYFADTDPVSGRGVVARVDTTSRRPVGRPIPVGSQPWGLAISADGARLYVANRGSRSVSVIDTTSAGVVATIAVSQDPTALALSPDGSRLYVAAADLNVIDTATNSLVATVAVANEATGVAASSDGRRVYVASSNRLTFVDAASQTVSFIVGGIGTDANGLALSPDDARAYVTVGNDAAVQVVDLVTMRRGDEVRGVSGATGISLRPDGAFAYVTGSRGSSIAVLGMAPRKASPSGVSVAGIPDLGQTLTAIPGIISSVPFPPAVTYQWQVGDSPDGPFADIAGQSRRTYSVARPDAGRFLRVALTAENGLGRTTIASRPTAQVPAPEPSSAGATPTPIASPPTRPIPPQTTPGPTAGPTSAPTAGPTSAPTAGPTSASTARRNSSPTPTARQKVSVKVKAKARRSKLLVRVSPSLGASSPWRFQVQKKKRGKWRTLKKTHLTKGPRQKRLVNLPKGKYRAIVAADYGYAGARSRAIRLKR